MISSRYTSKTSRVLGILLGFKLVGNMIVSKRNGNFTKYASRVRSLKEMSLGDKLCELETLFKGKISLRTLLTVLDVRFAFCWKSRFYRPMQHRTRSPQRPLRTKRDSFNRKHGESDVRSTASLLTTVITFV